MKKVITVTYISLLSVFTGIILSAQILGLLNFYYPVPVYVLSILLSCTFGFLLSKFSYHFIFESLDNSNKLPSPKWIRCTVITFAVLLFLVVLFLPLLLWPFTGITHELNWDAGLYHFTKAAEMVVTHSSWDLSIPYGEYPYGFESLIAASLLLSNAGYLIGCIHALILLFFTLSLFLVVNRYSRIQSEYIFFLVVAIISSYDIIRFTNLNPFMIFRVLAYTIGKNDFFLAALMIAAIYFAPIGPDHRKFNLLGLGMTSALICCTKPNGVFFLGFVWILALIRQIAIWREQREAKKTDLAIWGTVIILILIGSLWVVRNLVVQGAIISSDTLELQNSSILANLFNPLFYRSLGLIPLMISLLFLITLLASFFVKRIHWSIPSTFGVLIVSFIITPATLYFGASSQDLAIIFWRLGFYMLVYEVPILFLLLDPVFVWILQPKNLLIGKIVNVSLSFFMVAISLIACYQNYSRLLLDKTNTVVLRDQYTQSVGVDGYYSAYDYVRKNVTHSVVWVDNGLPFYIYGNPLTNSVTHLKPADYQLFLQTNWNGQSGFPAYLNTDAWNKEWTLVYSDNEGRVYKRISK